MRYWLLSPKSHVRTVSAFCARSDVRPGIGLSAGDASNADDCGIMLDKERFEVLHTEQFQNATQEIWRTDGVKRDLPFSTIAVLRDKKADKVFVLSVGHYASGVEGELFQQNWEYRRAVQWRQSHVNTKKRVNRLAKQYKADARLIVADFNVNFKKPWVRAFVKSFAPAYKNTWTNPEKVKGGTHGNRLIDATLIRGAIKVRGSARLYEDDNSSDHRPYIETLVWS